MNNIIIDGTIIKGIGGFYYVETANAVYECKARGSFRKAKISPLVGDRVQISVNDLSENRIEEIFPRKNSLVRPPLANIDQLMIVCSMADPSPNPFVVDKLIAIAELKGIEPIVVINKIDLGNPKELQKIYSNAGFKVIVADKEKANVKGELVPLLKGKLSAFTGNSGVGKSTILNILDNELSLETGEISKKLGRGRHTTRQVELFNLFGGYLADTPGFSSLELEKCEVILKEDLPDCFREFEKYQGMCKFSTCSHVNDKGCAILGAVENGEIEQSRHESYKMLYEQVKDVKEWELR